MLILFALVPLWSGIGMLRKRVWSAYGVALFELAQITIPLLVALRASAMSKSQLGLTVELNVVFALLFFLAGRKLAAEGASKGSPLAWITVCCVFTLPLLFFRAMVVPTGAMEDTLLIGGACCDGQSEAGDPLAKDLQAPLIPSRVCATIERQAFNQN